MRIVQHSENEPRPAKPPIPDAPCPECRNPGALIGITVYTHKYGKPTAAHFWCEDCELEFTEERP